MYKIFKSLIIIIWIFDILDMPFMAFLDTTYPVNFFGWLLIFIFLPVFNSDNSIKIKINSKD